MRREDASREAERPKRICVGVIVGAHGVGGQVRVKAFTERPEDVAAYGPLTDEHGADPLRLTVVGKAKGVVLCKVADVADRNRAEALKGRDLFTTRDALATDLEEEEYFHADLIGLLVEQRDGTPIGRVRAIYDFGAGDLLEVSREGGAPPVMLPFTKEVVVEMDVAGGRLVAMAPPGLLEDDERESGPQQG